MPLAGPPLPRPVLVSELLHRGVETKPGEAALVSVTTSRNWQQLDDVSQRLASSYLDMGLHPGDRVASLMPNRASLLIHYVACLKAGLVATPLNYRYMAPEIDHALSVSEASLLLAHVERGEDLAKSSLAARLPCGVVSFQDEGDERIGAGPTYRELTDAALPRRDLDAPASDAGAVIFFTSGSTGKPKGVTHTHETLGWILASFIESYGLTPQDVLLPGSSCSHIAGFVFALSGLAAGARVDIARQIVGEELLRLLRETRPTALCMLPAALFALVRDHEAKADDFASLRFCVSGGDKVSAELDEAFSKLSGQDVRECFGMSETGFTTWTPTGTELRLGSVGRPCAGYEVAIRGDDGRDVPVGSEGRLWVRFPGNTTGYWNNPKATAETIVDGWLDTGDVMAIDADGYLWFRGRKKQIIVHDGSNISPQEVEEAVMAHPAVATAGVVGVHDLVHGENVRAYVTLLEGAERPSEASVIATARERIGYKAPEEIVVLEEMPLNATGKVDRMLLKQMAAKAHEPAAGPAGIGLAGDR
jgi:acyl-CoA synthetase (AMP-forming)/AMP-acid ligase II